MTTQNLQIYIQQSGRRKVHRAKVKLRYSERSLNVAQRRIRLAVFSKHLPKFTVWSWLRRNLGRMGKMCAEHDSRWKLERSEYHDHIEAGRKLLNEYRVIRCHKTIANKQWKTFSDIKAGENFNWESCGVCAALLTVQLNRVSTETCDYSFLSGITIRSH